MGLIPYVGQAADVRDSVAAIWHVIENHDAASVAELGAAGIAWIPGLDFVKGGERTAARELGHEGGELGRHAAPNGDEPNVAEGRDSGNGSGAEPGAGGPSCGPSGCNVNTGPCFAAGTLVQTERGPRPIESVAVDDRVWSRDPLTGANQLQPVTRRFVTPRQHLIELQAGVDSSRAQLLRVTPEHPFWTQRGWTAALDLRRGDSILLLSGSWAPYLAGRDLGVTATVYNLEVASTHTYFVGELGLLVHNTCRKDLEQIPEPYYTDYGVELAKRDDVYRANADRWGVGGRGSNHENIIDHYLAHEQDFGPNFKPTLEQYTQMGVEAAIEAQTRQLPGTLVQGATPNVNRYRLDSFSYEGRQYTNLYVDYRLVPGEHGVLVPEIVSFGASG